MFINIFNEGNSTDYREAVLHISRFGIRSFTSLDLTDWPSKIFENSPKRSKKQNLNLSRTGNNSHSVYIVFSTI